MMQTSNHPRQEQSFKSLQVYSRGEYKVLPLCSGFVVVDSRGREIDRAGVDRVEDMIDTVDNLWLREVA